MTRCLRVGSMLVLACAMIAACSPSQPNSGATAAPSTAAAQPAAAAEPAHHDEHHAAPSTGPEPTKTLEGGARVFGRELSDRQMVALASVMATPASYAGQTIKTEGTIAQVCQRMGCWMELRATDGGEAVRVPMAGHSFFLPRDVAGRRATVEGVVDVEELDAETQAHLREEGAQAAGQALQIEATGVIVH